MQSDLTVESVVKAKDHVVSCELDDGAALLDMDKSIYYGLNPVAAEVWAAIQTPVAVSEISKLIREKFDTDSANVNTDLISLLQDMYASGLIDRVSAQAI